MDLEIVYGMVRFGVGSVLEVGLLFWRLVDVGWKW